MPIGLNARRDPIGLGQVIDGRNEDISAVPQTLNPGDPLAVRGNGHLPHRPAAVELMQNIIDLRAIDGERARFVRPG